MTRSMRQRRPARRGVFTVEVSRPSVSRSEIQYNIRARNSDEAARMARREYLRDLPDEERVGRKPRVRVEVLEPDIPEGF